MTMHVWVKLWNASPADPTLFTCVKLSDVVEWRNNAVYDCGQGRINPGDDKIDRIMKKTY